MLADYSEEYLDNLKPVIGRYGKQQEVEADELLKALKPGRDNGPLSLLRDPHDCWLLVQEPHISLIMLKQAAMALRDDELMELVEKVMSDNKRQRPG